jgi:hypothetical protein
MRPDDKAIAGGVPARGAARALSNPGRAYAIYIRGGERATLSLDLPAGRYRVEWVNTDTGGVEKREDLDHAGGVAQLASPPYRQDIALRVMVR